MHSHRFICSDCGTVASVGGGGSDDCFQSIFFLPVLPFNGNIDMELIFASHMSKLKDKASV